MPTKKRRSYRRRFKRAVRRSPKMATKVKNIAAVLIAASPVIGVAQSRLPSGDFQGFAQEVGSGYSAGLTEGTFNWNKALQFYGPVVGAYGFSKAIGFILKRFKI